MIENPVIVYIVLGVGIAATVAYSVGVLLVEAVSKVRRIVREETEGKEEV